MSEFWSVAVDAPLSQTLTYRAPDELKDKIKRGSLVHLPLGKRNVRGVVIGSQKQAPDVKLKNIQSIDEEHTELPDHFLKWLEWVSEYYNYPIGMVTSLAYPPLKKPTAIRKSKRTPVVPKVESTEKPNLTNEQAQVVESITKQNGFSTHLLFGVTGSGKTEVYLRLLEKTLEENKQGLVLVPEISLTPQLIHRFSSRFGEKIAVLHSQLTERERTNQWWEIIEGKKSILIGARSALFCPIQNLGVIIVDEEHEPSFKQDEKLKYHGRDAAIMLAKFSNCPIVLGSATPSLESWKNAQEKKYHLHRMTKRVAEQILPIVEVLDLRAEIKSPNYPSWMTKKLFESLESTLANKKQSALFLNRRGMAPVVLCGGCGYTAECPNCDISLTLHGKHDLVCHYCDYHEQYNEVCKDCHEGELKPFGLGTEAVERDLQKIFPDARIARADRDEIQNRADLEDLISRMENREIDILIGTQMIAKGLDFPHLHLVGLVFADVGFHLPDFRATERSFQLITQVSGRAGRHKTTGQVIIQTLNPDHPSITYAKNHDYCSFADYELEQRKVLLYPPYGRLISLRIQGTQLDQVQKTCRLLSQRAGQLKKQSEQYDTIEVLGPAEAPLSKLKGQFRYHLLLKSIDSKKLNIFARHVIGEENWLPSGVKLTTDVDPLNLL